MSSSTTTANDSEDYNSQLSHLKKTRSVLQAIKAATDNIYQDIYNVHQVNNPQILEESKALKLVIESLDWFRYR